MGFFSLQCDLRMIKLLEREIERLLKCTVCVFCFHKQYFHVDPLNIPWSLTYWKTEKHLHVPGKLSDTQSWHSPPRTSERIFMPQFSSVQSLSHVQLFEIPSPGFPVHHQLPELVLQVTDKSETFQVFQVTWSESKLDLTFQGILGG